MNAFDPDSHVETSFSLPEDMALLSDIGEQLRVIAPRLQHYIGHTAVKSDLEADILNSAVQLAELSVVISELSADLYLLAESSESTAESENRAAPLLQEELDAEAVNRVADSVNLTPRTISGSFLRLEDVSVQELLSRLSDRDQQLYAALLRSVGDSTGEWFARKEVDFSGVNFGVDSAGQPGVITAFWGKLLKAGLLVDNGKARGGKKYRLASDTRAPQEEMATNTLNTEQHDALTATLTSATDLDTAKLITPQSTRRRSSATTASGIVSDLAWQREVARFTQRLGSNIVRFLEEQPGRRARQVVVARFIAQSLGVTEDEAKTAVANIRQAGHIFDSGADSGFRYVGLEEELGSKRPISNDETKEVRAFEWDDENLDLAHKIVGELLRHRDTERGITVRAFITQLSARGVTDTQVRQVIKNIQARGVVNVRQAARPNNSRSRNQQVPKVTLAVGKKHHRAAFKADSKLLTRILIGELEVTDIKTPPQV